MTEIYETQSERTDLPLVVMPSVLDSTIEPIKAQFPALHDVARVRMFEESTSDEATIAERLKDADALLVGGYHISDDLLRTISGQGHVKCIVFCGTGVASYLNLDKARELKIRVCNAEHYGDHAVAEHTFALLFELIRRVGQLDKDVKAGNWAWASGDGLQLAGRRMGIIGLGGIGSTVAGIARALGMEVAAWNSHVPPEHFERSGATPVDDLEQAHRNQRRHLRPSAAEQRHARHRHRREPCACEARHPVHQHRPLRKSSNPVRCLPDCKRAMFPPHSTCSTMSR